MATEAPTCPKCKVSVGTPVNVECGVEPGSFHGPADSNLRCPACGTGWKGTDIEVADAWRSFVEWEQTQVDSPDEAPPIPREERIDLMLKDPSTHTPFCPNVMWGLACQCGARERIAEKLAR